MSELPPAGADVQRADSGPQAERPSVPGTRRVLVIDGGRGVGMTMDVLRAAGLPVVLEGNHEVRFPRPKPILVGQPVYARRRTIKTPVVNERPKLGRNERCPCGSGKKFKKCHLDKREA